MFDLFGLWAGVTVIIVALVSPLILAGFLVLRTLLGQILEDTEQAASLLGKIAYISRSGKWYFFPNGIPGRHGCYIDGGLVFDGALLWIASICVAFIMFVVLGATHSDMYHGLEVKPTFIEHIANIAAVCAPFFGSIASVVLLYVAVLFSGRFVVRSVRKLNFVIQKVEQYEAKDSD